MYEYRVKNIAKVIDGDTFDLDLDLGFYAQLRVRIRLNDIDTYEIYGVNTHEKGQEARDFADDWMQQAFNEGQLFIRTFKLQPQTPVADGAFGRWAADIFDSEGLSLADALREASFEELE